MKGTLSYNGQSTAIQWKKAPADACSQNLLDGFNAKMEQVV